MGSFEAVDRLAQILDVIALCLQFSLARHLRQDFLLLPPQLIFKATVEHLRRDSEGLHRK